MHAQGESSGFPGPDKTEIYFRSAIYDIVHVRREKTERQARYVPFLWGASSWPNLAPGSSACSLAQKTRAAQAQRGGISSPDRAETVSTSITYLLLIPFLNKGNRGHARPYFPPGHPFRQIPVRRAVSPWTRIRLPGRNSSRTGSILWWIGSFRRPECVPPKKPRFFRFYY